MSPAPGDLRRDRESASDTSACRRFARAGDKIHDRWKYHATLGHVDPAAHTVLRVLPRIAALVAVLATALFLPACATPPTGPIPATTNAPPPPAQPAPVAEDVPAVTVAHPKEVALVLDCADFLPEIMRATGLKVTIKADESSAELCRYGLPYTRTTTSASVFFRAEPPGTPSFRPIGELFGNTAYRVGKSDRKDCGLSVALAKDKPAHQHGSHVTVLASYEGVEPPCEVTERITEAIFDSLPPA